MSKGPMRGPKQMYSGGKLDKEAAKRLLSYLKPYRILKCIF